MFAGLAATFTIWRLNRGLLPFPNFSAANVGKDNFNATKSEFWSQDNDDGDALSDDDISASEGIHHICFRPGHVIANRIFLGVRIFLCAGRGHYATGMSSSYCCLSFHVIVILSGCGAFLLKMTRTMKLRVCLQQFQVEN